MGTKLERIAEISATTPKPEFNRKNMIANIGRLAYNIDVTEVRDI